MTFVNNKTGLNPEPGPNGKPRLLVLSHVLPFPGASGQQQRVANTLRALRERFHVTFVTTSAPQQQAEMSQKLTGFCDQPRLLDSLYDRGPLSRAWNQGASQVYAWRTGLKRSNYQIGQVEFAPTRLASLLESNAFDLALFEYWHAAGSVPAFRQYGIPCVLDMHDILWQTHNRQLESQKYLPAGLREHWRERYQQSEEQAWRTFDGIIAINHEELEYVRRQVPPTTKLFHAAMGVDQTQWPYCWTPATPLRLAYYGGLGNPHNQTDALICAQVLMPTIWQQFPEAELWLVGSNPPERLRALTTDARIKVTGFLEQAQPVLSTMTAVLCPFSGTFGFRSRLIEVMSLGVPVVVSPDAVYGMEMEIGQGVLLGQNHDELAAHALHLLQDSQFAAGQSRAARQQVEEKFSLDATYGALSRQLYEWLCNRQLGRQQ